MLRGGGPLQLDPVPRRGRHSSALRRTAPCLSQTAATTISVGFLMVTDGWAHSTARRPCTPRPPSKHAHRRALAARPPPPPQVLYVPQGRAVDASCIVRLHSRNNSAEELVVSEVAGSPLAEALARVLTPFRRPDYVPPPPQPAQQQPTAAAAAAAGGEEAEAGAGPRPMAVDSDAPAAVAAAAGGGGGGPPGGRPGPGAEQQQQLPEEAPGTPVRSTARGGAGAVADEPAGPAGAWNGGDGEAMDIAPIVQVRPGAGPCAAAAAQTLQRVVC